MFILNDIVSRDFFSFYRSGVIRDKATNISEILECPLFHGPGDATSFTHEIERPQTDLSDDGKEDGSSKQPQSVFLY